MNYYGIQTPDKPEIPSYIWWISNSEYSAWLSFFQYPSRDNERTPYRLPLADAIAAYEGIGYRCVKLRLEII